MSIPQNIQQFTWKEEDSAINQEGLEQMVRIKVNNTQQYWNFVRDFAEELKDNSPRHPYKRI